MQKEIDKEIQKSVKNSNLRQDKFWGNSCFWRGMGGKRGKIQLH